MIFPAIRRSGPQRSWLMRKLSSGSDQCGVQKPLWLSSRSFPRRDPCLNGQLNHGAGSSRRHTPHAQLWASLSTLTQPSHLDNQEEEEEEEERCENEDETESSVSLSAELSPLVGNIEVKENVDGKVQTTQAFTARMVAAPPQTNGFEIPPLTAEVEDPVEEADDPVEGEIADVDAYLQKRGITSRPVEGGMWNVQDPLGWAKDFGRRSASTQERLEPLIRLKQGDEGYHDVSETKTPPNVTVVRTKEQAAVVLKRLYGSTRRFYACDTEVMELDVKSEGPVGNGYVTCLSVYAGADFDFGLGDGPGTCLWVDNLDDACGILQEFKDWLEDERYLKVWHNVGFDRHVLWNEGIDVKGFGGDTMHMARLHDTSRMHEAPTPGYSLEALSQDLLNMQKVPMKDLFGVPRQRKDGSDGSIKDVPPVEVLQRDPQHRTKWIQYSATDARNTWELHRFLCSALKQVRWRSVLKGEPAAMNGDGEMRDMCEYYWRHLRRFGELLTDLERRGIRVNAKNYLAKVEQQARQDREAHLQTFLKWAAQQYPPELRAHGLALNPASAIQLQTFLFGGAENEKTGEPTELERTFKVPAEEISDEAWQAMEEKWQQEEQAKLKERDQLPLYEAVCEQLEEKFGPSVAVKLKDKCKEYGLKMTGTKRELFERLKDHILENTLTPTPITNPEAAVEPPTTMPSATEIDSMKVKDLRALCASWQIQGYSKLKKKDLQQRVTDFIASNPTPPSGPPAAQADEYGDYSDQDLRDTLVARYLSTSGGRDELVARLRLDAQTVGELVSAEESETSSTEAAKAKALREALDDPSSLLSGFLRSELSNKPAATDGLTERPKHVDVMVRSLRAMGKGELKPIKYTSGGAPSVTADVLRKLAGDPFADPPKYGVAENVVGAEGCEALASLCVIGSIDTMIANFLTSLQELVDEDSRVHGALNFNTETGRLSSRRPNLQNQPALEKDKYKIRKAFESSPGNNLIVADYGQLELRILASITECRSMIDAFESGGDFHSRTALDMFEYIQEKVDAGEVLLEWDYSKGKPTKPMLKDEFASERRKAKTLNFSIAYGKTAHGLSQDWGVTKKEAEEMLLKWYEARPEVRDWQANTKAGARRDGTTRTLMGRYRHLPGAMIGNPAKVRGHAERASINTPIQGGAADVVMMAMVKINDSKKLKALGWILLLQIHDEVILEGPEETAEEAFEEVLRCMESPWTVGLPETAVPLLVDGSCKHKTWYDAK